MGKRYIIVSKVCEKKALSLEVKDGNTIGMGILPFDSVFIKDSTGYRRIGTFLPTSTEDQILVEKILNLPSITYSFSPKESEELSRKIPRILYGFPTGYFTFVCI